MLEKNCNDAFFGTPFIFKIYRIDDTYLDGILKQFPSSIFRDNVCNNKG